MKKFIRLHNMCGCGHCKQSSCYGCSHSNYLISFGHNTKEYRLPEFIQFILRWIDN